MATASININKDKYVTEVDVSARTYDGTSTSLMVGDLNRSYVYPIQKHTAYLGLDIPPGKKITSAVLHIFINTISATGEKRLYAKRAFDYSTTLNEYDAIQSLEVHSGGYIVLGNQGQWYSIDVTNNVEYQYTRGKTSVAIALSAYSNESNISEPTEGVRIYNIATRESANKPYVVITYEEVAPNAPTNLLPVSETKLNSNIIRFSWQHNSFVGDTQSKFDLQWSSNSGQTWSTVTQSTSNQYYDMPANTLPVNNIIWKARTYSSQGIAGEYSVQAAFVSAGKPAAPTIVKPDALTNVSKPLIEWASVGQVAYQVQIMKASAIVWDSGEVLSTSMLQQVPVNLEDNTLYSAKVRVKNQYDIWSDWVSKNFTVDFEIPNMPLMEIIKDYARGSIRIKIINPTPDNAGGFRYNEVYRREISGSWMRIATNIVRNYVFEDCEIKSDTSYEYKVRTIGLQGFTDSISKIGDIKLKCSQLSSLLDTSLFVNLKYNAKRKISYQVESGSSVFAGREKSVTEFGEHKSKVLSFTGTLRDETTLERLVELTQSGQTLLYRDHKGRKMYCTASALDITENSSNWDISFILTEESHVEGV